MLTYTAEGRTPEPAASGDYGSEVDPELEVELYPDPDDALGIEELERGVAQLLERILGNIDRPRPRV